MRSLGLLLATLSLSESFAAAYSSGHRDIYHDQFGRELRRRNIVYNGQIASSYDFVIVGGGTAGLAVAARLSEDSNTTVLVLEAGDTGDAVADRVNTPVDAYYNGITGTSYDWGYKTVVQPNADGRNVSWPRGKLLGGSAAMNGMYHIRPSKPEVDAWASLMGGTDKWNWDAFFGAMQDSETFTAPSSDVQQTGDIQYVASNHGSSGPIHATYSGYMPPVNGNWSTTLENLGIAASADAYGGENWGSYISVLSINPSNWTRSYSRSGYIDPLPPRSNLDILPNATVTRLLFDTSNANNLTATGVEWAASASAARQTVKVNKEVVLAGGSIGSPQVLMLSGVGPSDVLQNAGVNVLLALPGVGQHLQDHISTQVVFKANIPSQRDLYNDNTDGDATNAAFLSAVNSAVAYVNLTTLLGSASAAASFQQQVASEFSSSQSSLCPSSDATVVAGYGAIYNTTLNTFLDSSVAQVELLLALNGAGAISVQAALQHPFSQGRIYLTSNNPFDTPAIDPQYLSHQADIAILREGLKLARTIGGTAPLNAATGAEISPGSSVQTDDEWDAWLAGQIGTEFHPSSSCAMLPREQGGVVDENLRVYGLANVRVADASVFPFDFSAHLQAPVYGVAEQAAKLIRATYNGVGWPSNSTATSTTTSSSGPTATDKPQDTHDNSAVSLSSRASVTLAVACVLASLLL